MGWAWNDKAKRYYNTDTGRFLTQSQAWEFVEESLAASKNISETLVGWVSEGMISPADWRLLFREELKGEYIRQAILGKGGRAQMTQSDWGVIGNQLKFQYGKLDNFTKEIASGNLSEAQIRARANMYINSAGQAFEAMQERVATAAGYDEESWHINAALENCPDCIDYRDMGWQPLGTFPTPKDGSTICLSSCGCTKEYRNSQTGDLFWGAEE